MPRKKKVIDTYLPLSVPGQPTPCCSTQPPNGCLKDICNIPPSSCPDDTPLRQHVINDSIQRDKALWKHFQHIKQELKSLQDSPSSEATPMEGKDSLIEQYNTLKIQLLQQHFKKAT